jgi:mono/diheme cytochrome c family protein
MLPGWLLGCACAIFPEKLMKFLRTTAILLALVLVTGIAFTCSGLFDPAADAPHSRPVYWVMENLRHRGIESRMSGIQSPDLKDPTLIRAGAGNYDAMCTDCHLKPGTTDSEMHRGLYPQPPALATMARPTLPDHAFWIIKHGIKASGMPAWGRSMDDQTIWGMVAFLQQLPTLTPEDYHEAVEQSEGHSHGAGEAVMNMSDINDPDEISGGSGSLAPSAAAGTHRDDDHDHQHADKQ